jgi:OOP family OmpA-OmpF porin
MTKSSMTPTPDLPRQQIPRPSTNRGWFLLVLIFRLLLLGVGGSLAAVVGIAIAQLLPGQLQEPPLVEKAIQGSQSLLTELKQLPETWSGKTPKAVAPSATPSPQTVQSSPVSETERQQLQNELTQLQAELQTLTESSTKPMETRIQPIQKRIQTIQQRLNAFTAAPGASASQTTEPVVAPATTSTLSGQTQLMVTLPSDALFSTDQKTLRPETKAILDSITGDLKQYSGATIRVGAHTDQQGSVEGDRVLSFEQAKTVEQYLSSKLGDDFHWTVVGYGHNQPLANDSAPVNRQRNRRIEIVIDPQ